MLRKLAPLWFIICKANKIYKKYFFKFAEKILTRGGFKLKGECWGFFHSTSSTFVQPWPAGPPGRLVKDEYGSGVVSGVGMAQMEAGPAQTVQHPPQEAGYPRLMSGETGQPHLPLQWNSIHRRNSL